ncbi:hypothetical protein HanRHA438_Chr13g0621891 [Helianthus annuus]|nr:hypothetical protein HanRHA438_Chr13g0621891 [Helianthus annuus]
MYGFRERENDGMKMLCVFAEYQMGKFVILMDTQMEDSGHVIWHVGDDDDVDVVVVVVDDGGGCGCSGDGDGVVVGMQVFKREKEI